MKSVRTGKSEKKPSGTAPLVTLRAGYGKALLSACTALAMVQGRLSHEMGYRVVALPTIKVWMCGKGGCTEVERGCPCNVCVSV